MTNTIDTWADGFGRWHAEVKQTNTHHADAEMACVLAYAAINQEIRERVNGAVDQDVTLVERHGNTYVYAEAIEGEST